MRGETLLKRAARTAATGIALATAACGGDTRDGPAMRAGNDDVSVRAFLEAHWSSPKAGTPAPKGGRASFDELMPAACGGCHPAQYADWRTSLHSRAMGAGVAGQLISMDEAGRRDCQRCHAPLQEQQDSPTALTGEGVACAGCHLRAGRVFGPPRRDGSTHPASRSAPHGGFAASDAFRDSRFCAPCHQFEADGFALNGKLLENTYEEWKRSRHSDEGRGCQSCHMPDRRHLWRGIHDPEMTRAGIAIEAIAPGPERDSQLTGGWRVTNSGTGHFFPTYVTPRVVATIRQERASGEPLEGTAAEYVIAREVSADLSEEISDTRIGPGEARALAYRMQRHPAATHLGLEIRVEPDAFYTGLYRRLLRDGIDGPGKDRIQEALAASIASRYLLHADRQPIR